MTTLRLIVAFLVAAIPSVWAESVPSRVPDAGVIFLSAWSRSTIENYLIPAREDLLCTSAMVANQGVYQLIHFKGSKRAILYFVEFVPNYPESIRVSNSACLMLSEGNWQIDDMPPAEGPTGGIANRQRWLHIASDLIKREAGVCTWSTLKAVLEQMPPPSLPDAKS